MHNRKRGARVAASLLAMALCFGLALSGCTSNPGAAEAQAPATQQPGQRIETFVIDPASFSLLTDRPATIEVTDHATTYTLQSDGDVTFEPSGAPAKTINLDPTDIVIERPLAGTITVVRDR